MIATIETAIELLIKKLDDKTTADEALKFTQASLNLAHVAATFDHMKVKAP